jgi:hypothetical protein
MVVLFTEANQSSIEHNHDVSECLRTSAAHESPIPSRFVNIRPSLFGSSLNGAMTLLQEGRPDRDVL